MTIEKAVQIIAKTAPTALAIVERINGEEDQFRIMGFAFGHSDAISLMRQMHNRYELDLDLADLISVESGRFVSWVI